MADEVLIPVRKPDGSVEKITKAEFLARQKNKPSVKPAAAATLVYPSLIRGGNKGGSPFRNTSATTHEPLLGKEGATQPSIKIKEEPVLEELPEVKTAAPRVSSNRNKEAEEIISKLNLKISAEAKNRLIGLIQLRLKDIRSEEEIKEWLTRPENQYGIGLDAAAGDRVIAAINDYMKKSKPDLSAAPVLKKTFGSPKQNEGGKNLLKEDQEPLPSTSSPINSFVHRSAPKQSEGGRKSLDDLVRADAARSTDNAASLVYRSPASARTIVRDIAPVKPLNMGPIDEIRYITLIDFRRLSSNPDEAAARLKQKFTNLREESYVLFMDAIDAWRKSPLFNDYIGASAVALNAGQKLNGAASDNNKIQMNEVKALIKMEKDLL